MPGAVRDPSQAFQQLEAIMLRQMLKSSGAFQAGSTPGAQLRTDMFVETLADAVAKAGGLGIARMLEHQLGTSPTAEGAHVTGAAPPRARPSSTSPVTTSLGSRPAAAAIGDDLDDPNSEAPLPEDPGASSIDDFQAPRGATMAGINVSPASAAGEVTTEVTSGFGPRVHPITHDRRFHAGVDFRAAEGAPIRAAAGGVVMDASRHSGYGNTVQIDHGNGTTTLYAHASALLVGEGQRVEAGQPVALVGHTGQATGPHLHFELRRNNHPVNPVSPEAPISIGRALNRYRERTEVTGAGTPSAAGEGDGT